MSAFFQPNGNNATIVLMVILAMSDFDPADSLKPMRGGLVAPPYRFVLR